MEREKTPFVRVCLFLVCCCLFLFACTVDKNEASINEAKPEVYEIHALDLEGEEFQKTIGWLTKETLLVHSGDMNGHRLLSFNIFTGESTVIYEGNLYLLSVEIHSGKKLIVVQEINDLETKLTVIDTEGSVIHSTPITYSGYVTLDWNAINPNLIFVSYYVYDVEKEEDTIEVYVWNTEAETLVRQDFASLLPKWYSANIYLYMDEIEGNRLYIGDIREETEDLLINPEVSDFFLHEDTFIGLTESDITERQVYLFHEYPLLVSDYVLTVPKVTMNGSPVKPHMTQSIRDGEVYGVIPTTPIQLEEDLGEYVLSKLSFEEGLIEEIIELPENAPILLCPDERFILYGWRYELLIDLDTLEIIPLITNTI